MRVLGLTGSMGMGKSTTAAMFREAGIPVFDADATVHALYRGRAAERIEAAFPGTVKEGVVDRTALSARLEGDRAAFSRLESIVHPLVREARAAFMARAVQDGARLVVWDIPLLFETGADGDVDAVLVVTAPPDIQRARIMERPGADAARLGAILARQMPDADKRRRAHFVIDTSHGLDYARRAVTDILRCLA